jgi:hypothetical protein
MKGFAGTAISMMSLVVPALMAYPIEIPPAEATLPSAIA